ncbi:unnamed protein product, partial [Meganyctiphanes norvegica]
KMWRYCAVTLLVLVALLGTTWGQEYPEGVQDGPCPDIGFKGVKWRFNYTGIAGTWHEQLRMKSSKQPNQCPTTNTWGGIPPDVTNIIAGITPDGSTFDVPREGVIGDAPNQRLYANPQPDLDFPNPDGLLLETIYTNYRNLHVFWTCSNLDGDKHIPFVWIESRTETLPKGMLKRTKRKLARWGIDVSRFWKVDMKFCTA